MKVPPADWFYRQIREGRIDKGADILPGQWVIFDVSRRPSYNGGKQMYTDSDGLGDILADLRDQGKIKLRDFCKEIPKNSRFAVSADEIDGKDRFIADRVASVLGLRPKERVGTPSYVVFNYIGNLAHPEFGQATNTWEWFADNCGHHGRRLLGGDSRYGGLAYVYPWPSDDHDHLHGGDIGFRLLISFPRLVSDK